VVVGMRPRGATEVVGIGFSPPSAMALATVARVLVGGLSSGRGVVLVRCRSL
jgi:hypothetical protein